tara:strand:- start:122 stop:424 length:303 start_codon:yes stop_codon:yes gene_type:complete
MLVSEEDEGILWVHPLFAAVMKSADTEPSGKPLVVTVDDCECIECDLKRGPIDFISTILVYIPTETGVIAQRLTPQEAEAIGKALIKFSQDVSSFQEETK